MRLITAILVLLWATTTSAQSSKTDVPRQGSISCTSDVPAETCVHAKGAFATAQRTSSAMYSLEVVIADRKSFQQEKARQRSKTDSNAKKYNSGNQSKQLSPSIFNILFEPGPDGMISKVVISTDLFGAVDVTEMDETKPIQSPRPLSFDKDSAMTWATYVMGYVDGSMWSRQNTSVGASGAQ